jgi:hypothetical protein
MVSANNQQGCEEVLEDDEEEDQEQEEARQQAWDRPPVMVVAHPVLLEMLAMLEKGQHSLALWDARRIWSAASLSSVMLFDHSILLTLFMDDCDWPQPCPPAISLCHQYGQCVGTSR